MFAKKSLGQNFLKNHEVVKDIIAAAEIKEGETVLEVGPGKGILTEALIEAGARVIAVEKDRRLIELLRKKFPTARIVEGDILNFDISSLFANCSPRFAGEAGKLNISSFKLVANIPYYITGTILEKFLTAQNQPTRVVLMLQKEVAKRVVAAPNSKDYGILSIAVQFYAVPEIAFNISRKSFYPEPKVDSSVLKIVPREKVAVDVRNEGLFWGLIKSAFYYRRKTLLNSLALSGHSKEIIKNVLEFAGIDQNKRPEQVSMEEWGKIADTLMEFMLSQQKRMKF